MRRLVTRKILNDADIIPAGLLLLVNRDRFTQRRVL
jgi:hypothetical protein